MKGEQVDVQAGDQLRVTVSGDEAEWVRAVRQTVTTILEPEIVLLATGDGQQSGNAGYLRCLCWLGGWRLRFC